MAAKTTAEGYARRRGYSVRAGSYVEATDDRLGRWYVVHESDDAPRLYGAGHVTRRAAWESAAEQAARLAAVEAMS